MRENIVEQPLEEMTDLSELNLDDKYIVEDANGNEVELTGREILNMDE